MRVLWVAQIFLTALLMWEFELNSIIQLQSVMMKTYETILPGGPMTSSSPPNSSALAKAQNSPSQDPPSAGLFEEFKAKHDQLRKMYEEKRREADGLLQEKKRLEIQLMNCNLDYYEREHKRLLADNERHQLDNEELKHRYFVTENLRKDMEASLKAHQEDCKNLRKLLEKERITAVELKHQLTEKERQTKQFITEVGGANQEISLRLQESNERANKAEGLVRIKIVEAEVLKKDLERAADKLRQLEDAHKAQKDKVDYSLYRSKGRIAELEAAAEELSSRFTESIKVLQERIKELEDRAIKSEIQLIKNAEASALQKELQTKNSEVRQLQQRISHLENEVTEQTKLIQNYEGQIKNKVSLEDYVEAEKRVSEANNRRVISERTLEGKINELERKLEKIKITHVEKPFQQRSQNIKSDFQCLLKTQIEESAKVRQELSLKIDEIFNLKAQIDELRSRQSSLLNEIDILKKKQKAEERNSKIGFDLEGQKLKSEVQLLSRKLEAAETRLASKMKEVKSKDQFIMETMLSRSKQEEVPYVMAEIKRIFEADCLSKLDEVTK